MLNNGQVTKLNFEGETIYVGIDTHRKQWRVAMYHDETVLKNFSHPANPDMLIKYLNNNYPGAKFICAYEAGFCGFWIQKHFAKKAIECLVLNPADVPTTHKEKEFKTDPRDARKIALSIRSNMVEGIFIHSDQGLEDRDLVRYYHDMSKNFARYKNKIKGKLYFHGINYPPQFESTNNHWSKAFFNWLQTINLKSEQGNYVLKSYIEECLAAKEKKRKARAKVNELSKTDTYKTMCQYLRSIAGVGLITSMTFLTEIEDINRFNTLNKLCAYIGLIPSTNSSGEKEGNKEVTKRGNKYLKNQIIESSWMTIRSDPGLFKVYADHRKRMKENKAIISVARKLAGRILFVMANRKPFEINPVN